MCWHAGGDDIRSGYRCGDNSLNGNAEWERIVLVPEAGLDADGDGVVDTEDNCLGLANDQADFDGDGVGDDCDNCGGLENADQADLDEDGIGDVCDDDVDGDGSPGADGDCDDRDAARYPEAEEICDDEIDNDCNEATDDDDEACAGPRRTLLVCGNMARDPAEFIPAGTDLQIVLHQAGNCQPDETTQAMLVTRSGDDGLDAAVLQAYLTAGGVVIGEYSTSHNLFNLAFDDEQPRGADRHMGSCTDNLPTVVQYSPEDRFWRDNAFQAIPDNETGCGYPINHLPGVTLLAGWNDQSAALGYRDLGAGRLWFVDVDWQDSQQSQTQYTKDLMGYMVTWRGEALACSDGATLLSATAAGDMALCKDEANQVCEQDFATICPADWHLCTPLEHHARNDGWAPGDFPEPALGIIRCRAGGADAGAGHYTVEDPAQDAAPNCRYGSSQPWCEAWYGCNEQRATALCCAPLPSCGNGQVDHPEEQCDDANEDDSDGCTASCYSGGC